MNPAIAAGGTQFTFGGGNVQQPPPGGQQLGPAGNQPFGGAPGAGATGGYRFG